MSPKEFERAAKRAGDFIKNRLPTVVGVEATKHFKESFDNEGFTDESLEKWPDITERRKEQKRKKNGNMSPILTDSRDLGDSLTWSEDGDSVVVSSDVVYAKRHNEGTNGMPKRQFMGPSRQLDKKIISKIERELDNIFK
ncbi:phage virion morphogenesis protein [Spirosoma areae]